MSHSLTIQTVESTLTLSAIEPSTLALSADGSSLTLAPVEQTLVLGIPQPLGVGEVNAAANVGGASEVFRDVAAGILNFRTLRGLGSVVIQESGDVIDISSVGSSTVQFLVDPTITDDSSTYSIGDTWINITAGTTWTLIDDTIGAAVWSQTAGPQWTEDVFIATGGQISFILSKPPTDPGSVEFDVNGINYQSGGSDYVRSGVTITWVSSLFNMNVGDRIQVRYR